MERNEIDRKTLNQFTQDNFTRAEYRNVKKMFSEEKNRALESLVKEHWNTLPVDQPLNNRLRRMLSAFSQQIGSNPKNSTHTILKYYQRVAAVLLLPLLLAFGYWLSLDSPVLPDSFATIHSPAGARTEFVLPDGTTGWLNSGSELSYAVNFQQDRKVKLKGEGYFNVVHRNGEKFRVLTGELTIQVHGTSFNVAAYKNDPEISVILKEGSVEVFGAQNSGNYIMKPNEKFDYSKSEKKAVVSQVNAEELTLWTKGLLQFNGEPLSEVVKKLARWYSVDFEIRDKQLQAYNFKATFENEQLDEILKMISLTTPMTYKIEDREKNENGIYKKRKIIIYGK